jgi:hypothetical protein
MFPDGSGQHFPKPNPLLAGGLDWNMAFIFHFIYGMSSFPLTNSYFSEG